MSARARASSAPCCAIERRAPRKRESSGARRNCSTTSASAPGRTIRRGALPTEIRGLEVRYGGIRAVKGIDLEIAAGELVCLIGANGAGKSSTLRAVSGLAQTARGSIRFGGRDLAGVPAFARARAGLVMVPEGRGVFAQLSVEENLAMGAYARADAGIATDRARGFELFPRLAERRPPTAGTLSRGEHKMLAIAP